MGASGRAYTSGRWLVRQGSEDDFIERWTDFTRWSLENAAGARSFRLIRADSNPQSFLSLGEWDGSDAVQAWRSDPGFRERMGRCRELCDEFEAGDYSLSVEVT
jgi:heme-degrading monooxygenase HmoA